LRAYRESQRRNTITQKTPATAAVTMRPTSVTAPGKPRKDPPGIRVRASRAPAVTAPIIV
jgi:hypothetical protein